MKKQRKSSTRLKKSEKGQLSLEFLLLMAGFLSILLLFMPLMNQAYNLGIFGIESVNAKNFAESFSQKTGELNFFADNSVMELEANPFAEWIVSVDKNTVSVKIENTELNVEKIFSEDLAVSIDSFSEKISKKTVFVLKKADGKISITHADS